MKDEKKEPGLNTELMLFASSWSPFGLPTILGDFIQWHARREEEGKDGKEV